MGNRLFLSFLIGVSGLLLLISYIFFGGSTQVPFIHNANAYLLALPSEYAREVTQMNITDSTFSSFVVDEFAQREIVIIRQRKRMELAEKIKLGEEKNSFEIQLYPLNSYIDTIFYNVANEPIFFVYDNKEYEVFRHALPFAELRKIMVKQNLKAKPGNKPWIEVITPEFTSIKPFSLNDSKDFEGQRRIPNIYNPLMMEMLSDKGIKTLPFSYFKIEDSLMEVWASYEKFVKKEHLTLAETERPEFFWNSLLKGDIKAVDKLTFQGSDVEGARQLLASYIHGEKSFQEVFDVKKLADFYVIKDLFYGNCPKVLKLFLNREEKRFEPFFEGLECAVSQNKFLKKSIIENKEYISEYIKSLYELANTDIRIDYIRISEKLREKLALINKSYPEQLFDGELLEINRKVIRKSLNPSTSLIAEVISMDKESLVMSLHNVSNYDLELIGLNHKSKKNVVFVEQGSIVESGDKDTLRIELPRSFENLFVTKKKKQTGFQFHKHIFDISLSYKVAGLLDVHNTKLIPYQPMQETLEDLFRNKIDVSEHPFLNVDDTKKVISNVVDSIAISTPLIIPESYIFSLAPGTKVNITKGGKIISHSPLRFIGRQNSPITIHSSDKKGQGILILANDKPSKLEYVNFSDLSNPRHGNWNVTGAITFYESPVELVNVSITNNKCEDALNIVRTNFSIENCHISNTQSDAFDGDFAEGIVSGCSFENLGNDAIDVSGSNITVKNVKIIRAGDKGLSAGEDSRMIVDNVRISHSEIAIAGKDLSIVEAKNLTFNSTKLGFTAFQKKPEYGPSYITVKSLKMNDVETDYLIESSSTLIVDGKKIETSQNVKDRMYGVEFGRSSAETRSNQ